MTVKLDLKRAERRIFRSYWSDGLLDMFVGASVLVIGLGWWAGAFVPSLAAPMVAFFLWGTVRKRVTEPRLGSVVFGERRRHDLWYGLVAIASLGLVVGGNLVTRTWMSNGHSGLAEWFAPAIPTTILAAMALSASAALGLWRFAGYGILLGATAIAAAATKGEPWHALIVAGTSITICGVLMLWAFLRHHPLPPAGQAQRTGS